MKHALVMIAFGVIAAAAAAAWAEEKIVKPPVKLEMVRIPAGQVEIAAVDEQGKVIPGKTVTVQIKPFQMSKTELVWDDYDVFWLKLDLFEKEKDELAVKEAPLLVAARSRPSNPYAAPDRNFGHESYGAISLPLNAAIRYCEWLSKKTGKKYRLPTEAEWEYACRAGKSTEPFSDKADLMEKAWFLDNSTDPDTGDLKTHEVATKRPNAFGLYDMLGNVGEWTICLNKAGTGVVKGGSYKDKAVNVHSRARALYDPMWQQQDPQDPKSNWWASDGPHLGFRVVMEEE